MKWYRALARARNMIILTLPMWRPYNSTEHMLAKLILAATQRLHSSILVRHFVRVWAPKHPHLADFIIYIKRWLSFHHFIEHMNWNDIEIGFGQLAFVGILCARWREKGGYVNLVNLVSIAIDKPCETMVKLCKADIQGHSIWFFICGNNKSGTNELWI